VRPVTALLAAGVAVVVGVVGLWIARREPATDACARQYDRAARLECRARLGLGEAGDMRDVRALLDRTADPTERDLLVLRLVMDDPRRGRWACERVGEARMRRWCEDIHGRTHLSPVGDRGEP
jgi:hypothetical protein